MRSILGAVLALIMLVTTACATHEEKAPEPSEPRVAITDFSETCKRETCWLPTQFEPRLVGGQSVSLHNQWPMDGDTVRVVCQTKGDAYRDTTGTELRQWYGIFVPADKASPEALDGTYPEARPIQDGYLGFVGVSWIDGLQQTPSECK